MTNWLNQQLQSKLFRKLFLAIVAATIIPVVVLTIAAVFNGFLFTSNKVVSIVSISIGFLFFAVLIAGIVAFYISKYITTPLSEFSESATQIARGKFSHKVNINTDDELGRLARLFNYMTTEMRRLNEMNLAQIIAERNKTQTIIKNIADGVIVTDPQLNILILNATAERWFGLDEGHSIDKPLTDCIDEPRLLHLIQEASEQERGDLPSVDIEIKRQGSWQPLILQANSARVMHQTEGLIGIVTILRDITQQKEIDRMKTELVSMVAHELRSPLTSISGFSELLLDPDLEREQANEYISIILNESSRLGELINKFLDISRIESGRIQPQKSQVDLVEVVSMVVGNNSYLATQKNIKVLVDEIDNPVYIWADNGMIEQIVLNLFSNAIKYSPDNTQIILNFKSENSHVEIQVVDQGFGIPEHDLENIFKKFYRVSDNEKLQDIKGSGLGLSLVKQLVEIHDGQISVHSIVGEGSTFSVIFPKYGPNNS